jgi:hypothetical protein
MDPATALEKELSIEQRTRADKEKALKREIRCQRLLQEIQIEKERKEYIIRTELEIERKKEKLALQERKRQQQIEQMKQEIQEAKLQKARKLQELEEEKLVLCKEIALKRLIRKERIRLAHEQDVEELNMKLERKISEDLKRLKGDLKEKDRLIGDIKREEAIIDDVDLYDNFDTWHMSAVNLRGQMADYQLNPDHSLVKARSVPASLQISSDPFVAGSFRYAFYSKVNRDVMVAKIHKDSRSEDEKIQLALETLKISEHCHSVLFEDYVLLPPLCWVLFPRMEGEREIEMTH